MPNKRILLMHISNISGHRSAGMAIEKAIQIQSPQVETLSLNAFNYVHPHGERIINFFYMFVVQRLPFIWTHLYDNYYWVKKTRRLKNAIHYLNLPKLETLFNNFRPDVVISTQAFPCGMVAAFKQSKKNNLPLVAVLTDFAPHSYWIYDDVDYYITPSEEIRQQLIEKGALPARIKSLGIPFDPKFNQVFSKAEIRTRLNLSANLFTILIMGGGQGLGPIRGMVKILGDLELGFQVIIVCGTNDSLYRKLQKQVVQYSKRLILLNYAENMEELMSAADIIITKPGGITCAEALSKGLPMLIVSPIPGQEASNTAYLIKEGAAIKINNVQELNSVIRDLYNHPEKINKLSEAARRISKPNAAHDIARLLLSL
ncbi:MAG: glycosyltransferase [Candidatus Omnitrophota bacterium]